MKRSVFALMIVMLLWGTVVAGSQESILHRFKVGITAGTGLHFDNQMSQSLLEDAWIGVILHITPLIAVRPGFALNVTDEDIIDNLNPLNSEHPEDGAFGVSLGVLFFLPRKNNFFLYFGPEGKFYHSSQLSYYDNGDKKSDYAFQIFSIAALAGTQYMFSDRFGFQADIGLAFVSTTGHTRNWDNVGTLITNKDTEEARIYSRGAYLGAVFYFN